MKRQIKVWYLVQVPVIGWLMKVLFDVEGDSRGERRMRRIENALFAGGVAAGTHPQTLDLTTAAFSAPPREELSWEIAAESDRRSGPPSSGAAPAASRLRTLPAPRRWGKEKHNG